MSLKCALEKTLEKKNEEDDFMCGYTKKEWVEMAVN